MDAMKLERIKQTATTEMLGRRTDVGMFEKNGDVANAEYSRGYAHGISFVIFLLAQAEAEDEERED